MYNLLRPSDIQRTYHSITDTSPLIRVQLRTSEHHVQLAAAK